MSDVTILLNKVRSGEQAALDELLVTVYGDLKRIAGQQLRNERPDHTLQAPALVNEAYLRLFHDKLPEFANRAHFYAVVSRVMRQILVDYARAHNAGKRAGQLKRVTWGPLVDAEWNGEAVGLFELHEAMDALALENKDLAQLVELRYFGGLTAEESAEVVGRSVHTVRHDLRFAHAWLKREMARR